jgi:hypothetical protein
MAVVALRVALLASSRNQIRVRLVGSVKNFFWKQVTLSLLFDN